MMYMIGLYNILFNYVSSKEDSDCRKVYKVMHRKVNEGIDRRATEKWDKKVDRDGWVDKDEPCCWSCLLSSRACRI